MSRINRALEVFKQAWNLHPLSSEGNLSPCQLWIAGCESVSMTDIMIHTSYSGSTYNTQEDISDASVLLNKFNTGDGQGKVWDGYCLAHLFTYWVLSNGLLGLSNIASPSATTTGGICSTSFFSSSSGTRIIYNTALSSYTSSSNPLVFVEEVLMFSNCSRTSIGAVLSAKAQNCFTVRGTGHEKDSPPGGPPDPESDTNDVVISVFINKIINPDKSFGSSWSILPPNIHDSNKHKCFHTLFDLLKYGLMLKYNVMCSSLGPMEELTASPPYPSWSRTEIHDLTANLMAGVCHNVSIAPNLQPTTGETFATNQLTWKMLLSQTLQLMDFEVGNSKGHF
ncbi:hypothetical protein EMCRGX_G009496 [Ephydatia muelleri]